MVVDFIPEHEVLFVTLHPDDGFQQLQSVKLHVVVGVVLLEVLHQQLVVIEVLCLQVCLLHVLLQVAVMCEM